jgi:hypothetical protein
MQTFTFIYILFLAILASESCFELSKTVDNDFYLNLIQFLRSSIKLIVAYFIHFVTLREKFSGELKFVMFS